MDELKIKKVIMDYGNDINMMYNINDNDERGKHYFTLLFDY